ncbi:hypothetical protein [Cytobacillus massiliigabonensis]|uniref:hypothetical protein n=1 Tax=Cytobacillus massiliigabonensis TaxID=1871011 RepID=UPI000C84DE38|nr:hypothetical protein [Cytobacillus massiliigabonensis]
MNSTTKNIQEDFEGIKLNIDCMIETLGYINLDIQSPNVKREIHHIESLLTSLRDNIENDEIKYLQMLIEKERRMKMVEDERFRTNYNNSVDGRIWNTYYSGQGDMGIKK